MKDLIKFTFVHGSSEDWNKLKQTSIPDDGFYFSNKDSQSVIATHRIDWAV